MTVKIIKKKRFTYEKSIYYKQIPARHAKENNINQKSLYQKVD